MRSNLVALTVALFSSLVYGQSSPNEAAASDVATRGAEQSIPQTLPLQPARRTWTPTGRSLKDWKLADIAIVATLDGGLHALERDTGDIRWTIASAECAIQSKNGVPYNSTVPALLEAEKETWIVEPIDDGCLYTFSTREGLKKLPFGIKQLVENSPFTVPGDDKVYVGERKTTLYSVDPKTGNVLQAYGTDFGHTASNAPKCPKRDSLDELDDDLECVMPDPNAKDALKIGRNTYTLTIFSGAELLWNITYTEWVPNSIDSDLKRQYENTFDGRYISPLYDGRVLAHQTETNDAVWFKQLSAPAVRVYDVLQQYDPQMRSYAPEISGVAVVPQPLDPHFAEVGHENYVDGAHTTYVGVTDDGDWFAISAAKCPLVSGAPVSKWSNGLSSGTVEDLLGTHQHQQTREMEQPASPGHLLTIDSPYPADQKTIGESQRPAYSKLWMLYSIVATLLAIGLGFNKLSKSYQTSLAESSEPAFNKDPPQVRFAEEVSSIIPETSTLKESILESTSASVPVTSDDVSPDDQMSNEVQSPNLGATKARRKRGSRGGKKNREANVTRLQKEDSDETEVIPDEPAPTIIKAIPARPIASESLFPLQINSLLVTDKILGYGSHGTIVYQGTFEGRDVAVKRMLLDFYDIASHEVVLLQESDDHPNVIRYYCKQENERFLYIALELCAASLADVTERPREFEELAESMNDVVSIIRQMALGVQYLHSLKIVHRDLKPQNILVNPPRKSVVRNAKEQCARLVISDFGLCKKLDADQSSFRATTAQAAGTSGWRAPELLCDDTSDRGDQTTSALETSTSGSASTVNATGTPRKVSRAIDIFSLGCVFYYVLSNGAHPFGDRYMREANIIKHHHTLDHLVLLGDQGVLARDLITSMIEADPKLRPDASTVLQHPFFWSAEKSLTFLLDISDRFEIEERDPPSPLLAMLESAAGPVLNANWHQKLDRHLLDNLGRYRKYNAASILDLLRALRNKKHHYQDLPESVQVALGSVPAGFLRYFTTRFPLLLVHTYYLAKRELAHEPMFEAYYAS